MPLIGLTPTPVAVAQIHGRFRELHLNEAYAAAVLAAGGLPVMLASAADPVACLDRIDGLVLTGGGDVDPTSYGGPPPDDRHYGIDEERDRFETDIFLLALDRGLPVFAICRGLQVMNVALGGTLHHHIEADPAGGAGAVHRQQEAGMPPDADWHPVALANHPAAGILADGREIIVHSFHHQGIRDLAPGLMPIGTAPDGLVEAVTASGPGFTLGVQWHPELMFRRDHSHLRGFRAHVAAAEAFAAGREERVAASV